MELKRIDIAERLGKLKNPEDENSILEEVARILEKDKRQEKRITKELAGSAKKPDNDFVFDLLETDRIFHISQIRSICIDYRLRFLDSRYFKGQIPNSALQEIKRIERLHQLNIKGYKLVAPSRMFRLEDRDDPLLFAPIGNNYYYFNR